jgi:hypothetical protein
VQIPNFKKKHIVNFKEYICNCTQFKEYDSLYTHTIVAYRHKVEDLYKLFVKQYTMSIYKGTYNHFLQPFSIKNLLSTLRFLLPVFKKQRSRLTTKRI